MIPKSENLLTDELIRTSSWEYFFHLSKLFQSMLLMVWSFTFLMLYQSEYSPNTLPVLLIISTFWKSLHPKILYSTKFTAELTLTLVSAIFYQIFIYHQMIVLQEIWKIFLNSSKDFFSLSSFCVFVFPSFSPCQPLL